MKKSLQKIVIFFVILASLVFGAFKINERHIDKKDVTYGTTFSIEYTNYLGLDWKETFNAISGDLGIKHIRVPIYWHITEPKNGEYNFEDIDWVMNQAQKNNTKIILSVGKRLPRWPECHIPKWTATLSEAQFESVLKEYVAKVVLRYKDNPALLYWQVENEPFLTVYARETCGKEGDPKLLDEEVGIVRNIDKDSKIMITDSGNFGLWFESYKRADILGYSLYQYVYDKNFGEIKSWLPAGYYRLKANFVNWFFNTQKPMVLSELSLEPWLEHAIIDSPLELINKRMNAKRVKEILTFALNTGEKEQYLWGAEWWYYMKKQYNDDSIWETVKRWVNED